MNKTTKKILRTVTGIIVALIIIGGAVWMITGLSPQALIVRAFLKPMTMDKYEEAMNDKTDKSTTEIPAEVKFPREVASKAQLLCLQTQSHTRQPSKFSSSCLFFHASTCLSLTMSS